MVTLLLLDTRLLFGSNHSIVGDPVIPSSVTVQFRLYDCPAVRGPGSCLIETLRVSIVIVGNISYGNIVLLHKIQVMCL